MNKKGVSQVVSAVLLITLVIAMAATFSYVYISLVYSYEDPIKGTFFEEIGVKRSCYPNYAPGEWSGCEVSYNLNNLVFGDVFLEGTKERSLEDLNRCEPDKLETEKCSAKEMVSLQKVEKCSRDYLEVRDKDGNLVSNVELEKDSGELNIQFVLGNIAYCSYCNDGIKNFDEDEIDCVYSGDSCPLCI